MSGGQMRSGSVDEPIDRSTAEMLEEIEQTRVAMHDTVEAIGDRLAPAAIVQNAKETVREATVGKVEDMADSAAQMFSEAGTTAQEAGYGIVATVRRNPIPAAMAGIGIAWLMTHRSPGATRASTWHGGRWQDRRDASPSLPERDGGRDLTDAVGERVDAVGQRVGEIGDRVGQKAGDGVDALTQRAGRVGDRVGEVPGQLEYRVHDLSEQARMLIQDSPLAVGAVAVAVGTALGAALPSTSMERRVLGPAADKAIGTAEETASKALGGLERDARSTSPSGASASGGGATQE